VLRFTNQQWSWCVRMQRERSGSSSHLPSLDGLRAISIVLVLIGHLEGTRKFGHLPGIFAFGNLAHFGVTVFFVISGFLITSLLIKEYERTGGISLKLFYLRRALRIFPAAFAYIGVICLLSAVGAIAVTRTDLLFAATYTVNYLIHPAWYIGHLWSLSVEEQFYLLWPFTFAVFGPRRAVWVAGASVFLGAGFRALDWFFLRHTAYYAMPMFPMVADSLAAGCLLATCRKYLESQSWYLTLFRPHWSLLMLATILVTNRYMNHTIFLVAGTALINVLLAVLIHRSVFCWRDRMGQLLNWKPVAFIGVLSYSLYLWQQPFLNRDSSAWPAGFPQNLVFAFAAAMASYLFLEKPLMRLRNRLRTQSGTEPVECASDKVLGTTA
jgi:peptidoglycan/LPS O-acetylase OafA/YrhL